MTSMTSLKRPAARALGVILAPMHLLERSRGWRRRLLIVAYLIVGTFVGSLVWRQASLRDLPDVGDPFDVAAFAREAGSVPEADDAFVLYREAADRLVDTPESRDWNGMFGAVRAGWGASTPALKSWVVQNRAILALWREGTGRPDAMPEPPGAIPLVADATYPAQLLRLGQMALLEGSRLEEHGDFAGAWGWYRAVLRCSRHMKTRSRYPMRASGVALEGQALARLSPWAKGAKLSIEAHREVLRDVLALDESEPPASDNLKAEYLALRGALGDPVRFQKWTETADNNPYSYDQFWAWHRISWFYKREPERSLRVARLFFANRLAQIDRPKAARPAEVGNDPRWPNWTMYVADPSAPEAARAIEPGALFRRLDSSMIWRILPSTRYFEPDVEAERKGRALLIMTLAEQLHLRERGRYPAKDADLVGPYLKRLPIGIENIAPPEVRRP